MTVFISGRITGDPDYKKKFADAACFIERKLGDAVVLTPADLPKGLKEKDYMRISLAMLEAADIAVFLSGFSQSKGSVAEYSYCKKLGIPTLTCDIVKEMRDL